MTIAEYNRQQANTPEQPEPSATIQKFRREKKLAEDLAAELAVIRNAEPLQPGGQDAPKGKAKRLLPRTRRESEIKQYQISRTEIAPAKKPQMK